jgi:hypothetical protein
MDHNGQDPDYGSPNSGARVEDDFVRPLKPMRGHPHHRLGAAMPLAIAGILVVSGLAFGATVVQSIVAPPPTASAIVVGDDDPTDAPTDAPTDVPTDRPTATPTATPTDAPTDAPTTAPTPGQLTISVEALAGKARITWSAYTGSDFAYYKVVRSAGGTADWPLGSGDTLVAAISNHATVTYLDSCGAGTFTYRVFAVRSADSGYEVLASSGNKTVTVAPAPTKAPTPVSDPTDMGALRVTDNGDGTYTFSWNAYTGPIDFTYYKLDGQPFPHTPGYVENGGHYWSCVGTDTTSTTIAVEPGTWNIVVEAVYYPNGGSAAAGKTDVLKLAVAPHTAPPVLTLTLQGYAASNGVHLAWSKYTGPYFSDYGIVRTTGSTAPVLQLGTTPPFYFGDVNKLNYIDTTHLAPGTYHYRVYAFSDQTLAPAGLMAPACQAGTILAVSNILDITITVSASPTPTPTPVATPVPTPTPTGGA